MGVLRSAESDVGGGVFGVKAQFELGAGTQAGDVGAMAIDDDRDDGDAGDCVGRWRVIRGESKIAPIAVRIATLIDATDMYFVSSRIIAIGMSKNQSHGIKAKTTPPPVATPLPPLKPMKIDQQWPATAENPAAAITQRFSPSQLATNTGIMPFTKSSTAPRPRISPPSTR